MRQLVGLTISTAVLVLTVLLGAAWLFGSWSEQRQQLMTYSQLSQQTQLLSSNLQQTLGILRSGLSQTHEAASQQVADATSLQETGGSALSSRPLLDSKIFDAVGLVSKNSKNIWRANWLVKGQDAKSKRLSISSINKALTRVKLTSNKENHLNLQTFVVNKQKYLAVLLSKSENSPGRELVLGLMSADYLSRLSYLQQTPEQSVYLFSDKSLALVHPKRRYIGANETAHPIARRLKASTQIVNQLNYKGNDGEKREAVSEKVGQSNLTVIVEQRSPAGLMASLGFAQWFLFVVLWLGVSFCGALALFKFFSLEQVKISYLRKALIALSKRQSLPKAPKSLSSDRYLSHVLKELRSVVMSPKPEVESKANKKEVQVEALKTEPAPLKVENTTHPESVKSFATELINRMKSPAFSIQGYVELAKVRPDDDSLDENLKKISSEAKKIKSVVQDLILFTKEGPKGVSVESEVFVIEDGALDILKSESKDLELRGYRLSKRLGTNHHVKGNLMYFEKAFASITRFLKTNAAGSARDFLVTSDKAGDTVELYLKTSIFSGNMGQHLESDYDLLVARSALRAQGGDLKVSDGSKYNCQFTIILPLASDSDVWTARREDEVQVQQAREVLEEQDDVPGEVAAEVVEERLEGSDEMLVAEAVENEGVEAQGFDDEITDITEPSELVEDTFKLANLIETPPAGTAVTYEDEIAQGEKSLAAEEPGEDVYVAPDSPSWSIEEVVSANEPEGELEEDTFVTADKTSKAKISIPKPKIRV